MNLVKARRSSLGRHARHPEQHFEKVLENGLVKRTAFHYHVISEFALLTYSFDENLFFNTL